jgi:hypothetical protein
MTDVDGPFVPALRFSSLLILGAETAIVAGADQSALEVNCNMAQAFEIPGRNSQGDRTAHHCTPARVQEDHHKVPSNAFQIAAPGPIQRRIGTFAYGSGLGLPQAHQGCPAASVTGPNPGPAIPARLIVSA